MLYCVCTPWRRHLPVGYWGRLLLLRSVPPYTNGCRVTTRCQPHTPRTCCPLLRAPAPARRCKTRTWTMPDAPKYVPLAFRTLLAARHVTDAQDAMRACAAAAVRWLLAPRAGRHAAATPPSFPAYLLHYAARVALALALTHGPCLTVVAGVRCAQLLETGKLSAGRCCIQHTLSHEALRSHTRVLARALAHVLPCVWCV